MKTKRTLLMLAYVVIAAAVVFAVISTKGFGLIKKDATASSDWSAVFLSNGQVYFGHLSGFTSQFATLTSIYYLQVDQQQDLQKGKDATTQPPKLSLIKLGNELHGPMDEMKINRDQILFFENMKNDSKVVSAINDYIKNPKP